MALGLISSPSECHRIPNEAPQRRVAFSSIASNTGARSPGDELMTWRTSAVAVCCSRAELCAKVGDGLTG
jgi:hypothetical protein